MSVVDKPFLDQALAVARQAADKAEEVIAFYFGKSLVVESKSDESPVTIADREAEKAIRAQIKAVFPDHAIFGEEFGRNSKESDFLWLIDPIDGTKSFVRGHTFFSTQIALMYKDEIILGVSSAKHFGEVAWATKGGGAWLNDKRIQVSDCASVDQAHISFGNLKTLASDERWIRLAQIVRHAGRVRGYGDFCQYHMLARGAEDAVIESDINILDIAALSLLVTEAGGVFTDLNGKPIDMQSTSALAANAQLHKVLLASFGD